MLDLRLFGGWVGKGRERVEICKENRERGSRSPWRGREMEGEIGGFFHKIFI